jgi:hypothetical protein
LTSFIDLPVVLLLFLPWLAVKLCGFSMPVALSPVMDGPNDDELRTKLAWLVGVEGGGGMLRDVFRVVLDLLMPWWHSLRRKAQGPPRT